MFRSISGPSPESEPRMPSENSFKVFLAPTRKRSPRDVQRTVFKYFWPQPGKYAQDVSRNQEILKVGRLSKNVAPTIKKQIIYNF